MEAFFYYISQTEGGIRAGQRGSGSCCAGQVVRGGEKVLQAGCQCLCGKVGLADHPACARVGYGAGVFGLLIGGGNRQGDHERRAACGGNFRHRGAACPPDDQMGCAQDVGHIVQKRLHTGLHANIGIGFAHGVHVIRAGLLGNVDACAQGGWQAANGCGYHLRKNARPQRATPDQQVDRLIRGGPCFPRQCGNAGAHGHAGQHGSGPHGQLGHGGEGGGNHVRKAGEHGIGLAQNGIAFMNDQRRVPAAEQPRAQQGRNGGVAAKADDRIRLKSVQDAPCLPCAGQ